ncbi:polyprenol phosphomannose-dependent alpha 1,6 mannosyltransferase MptB [Mycobacterium sp.]|uniref:polyprenol phosphomannose-dependent alpha 1,6 mannosyltransferase MptB n=3 Tax=Mycobacterium sp. TaxID=1785 RepID=UPI0031D68BB2
MATGQHTLSSSIARLHGDEQPVGRPLDDRELVAVRRTRLFGATGTVLMAIGALGAGARPVIQDPTFGVRLLNLPSRIQTVSLTMTTTGAVMMALAWLMLGRFALGERRMSRGELDRTLLLWMLPLLAAPPMYSKDVYSYLAQSQICRLGLDPYTVGPARALGLDHVFTLSVPSLWRETPAPYGPLFLWLGRGVSELTGENIVAAVLCHRLVVLFGVGLIVWATPRLARRCGVAEVSALWLGAANPLLIMHLVAGIHNEALMLGLMLTGTEVALRGLGTPGATRTLLPRDPTRRRDWAPLGLLLAGSVLITLSAQVKLPSLVALGFVAMALARRWGGTLRALVLAGGLMGGLSLAVMAVVGWASGLGFGWIFTLGTANVVRSWMSPPTLLALGAGQAGILLGLGDHTTAVLSLTRGIGVLIIAVMVCWLLLLVFRGRLHPVGGLGVALGVTVLLFPVVQPWYVLWAVIPLAAWATRPSFRIAAIGVTIVVGVFGPTANGDRFALFQIIDATVASTIVVLVLIGVTSRRLPWRALPAAGRELLHDAVTLDVVSATTTGQPAALPGAYAEPREFVDDPRAAARGVQAVRVGPVRRESRRRP